MKHEKSAGVIIFFVENGKPLYLVLKYQRYGRVHWGFAKGGISKGEMEVETAKREVKEEAGLKDLIFIRGFKEKEHFFFRAEEKELVSKDVVMFLAETKRKDVKLSFEHSEFKWLPFADALKQIKYKNQREILTKANSLVQEWLKQKRL